MNLLEVESLEKTFTLHLRGGQRLPTLRAPDFQLQAGECVALRGPSGAGKSTLLRCVFGSYRVDSGSIYLHHQQQCLELSRADSRSILDARRWSMAYASQFLRVIPRVSTLAIVAEPALLQGKSDTEAAARARELLLRLNIPLALHHLPPASFSGGEQQRVNVARTLIGTHPLLLLDEPTASLDPANAALILAEIRRAKEKIGRAHV